MNEQDKKTMIDNICKEIIFRVFSQCDSLFEYDEILSQISKNLCRPIKEASEK